mmetsp:Transcript_136146/g.236648  ORF Transcript_136146/g.236648 Transcript_136146/m.236648 type:complete len:161 (-) Transcript_136146:203-685(-)
MTFAPIGNKDKTKLYDNTAQHCKFYKESIQKELAISHKAANEVIFKLGGLKKNNAYLRLFKSDKAPVHKEHKWTLDKCQDKTEYDPSIQHDTFHPMHTEEARKRCKVPFITKWQARSSQAYGWLPPVDEPKYGFGRSSIFMESAMDKSHLGVGKAYQPLT